MSRCVQLITRGIKKMSAIRVKCGYCGQMTKEENCGYYKGILIHNKLNCNCIQAAIKTNFFVAPPEKERY
jgi:hypothetical protein